MSEFYKVRTRADGHHTYCKKCCKKKQHENKEYYMLYQRKLRGIDGINKKVGRFERTGLKGITGSEYFKEYYRIKRLNPDFKKRETERARILRQKYPQKYKARLETIEAIRIGKLKRGNCEVCGKPNAQAHHSDYSKPLEVKWLCIKHHFELHKELRKNDSP